MLLGKHNPGVGSNSIRLTAASFDEMASGQQHHLQCPRELWLDIKIQNSHPSTKCISPQSHNLSFFFIALLYYCIFIRAAQSCLINFHYNLANHKPVRSNNHLLSVHIHNNGETSGKRSELLTVSFLMRTHRTLRKGEQPSF